MTKDRKDKLEMIGYLMQSEDIPLELIDDFIRISNIFINQKRRLEDNRQFNLYPMDE